ncbi:MAG: hypothetical protein GX491_14385 [Chloroflexi bacterium]|nr:hypothetical protein [Chloroflexota bacterium]
MIYSSSSPYSGDSADRQFTIYLALSQYPVLSERIRARMRDELYERGIITPQQFESEVRLVGIRTQQQEGLRNPFGEEDAEVWEYRLSRVRETLTDQLFARHLSFELFEQLVWEVLSERGVQTQQLSLAMNPEISPLELVFEQALMIENLPAAERSAAERPDLEARLKELKVVLIRTIISDHLRYINVAKDWFTVNDLVEIRRRKIGTGKIGGKAAGMLLAKRILEESGDEDIRSSISVPDSFFIGSDVFYTFMAINNLVHWNDQKYKTEADMRAEYPQIERDFAAGEFPLDFLADLSELLDRVGQRPLIVRSSSLLEDNFGTSFAGKYESVFCPNQGSRAACLKALTQAIIKVYSSTLNPNALLYRRLKGLQDYDERMAILIQVVEGETYGKYFFPQAAGVAFSRNLYRWAPNIRSEDGFARLVWGLGTRAVDRVGNDFPRLVALSHPLLRPSTDPASIRRYSQQFIDVLDLEKNIFCTLPIREVLDTRYPPLRYIAQIEEEGYLTSLRSRLVSSSTGQLVVTFDELLRRTPFAERLRKMLQILEAHYHSPVDVEFTLHIKDLDSVKPEICITILQCRPQSYFVSEDQASLPAKLKPEDIIFSTRFVVPQGLIPAVDYVVYIPPEQYFSLPTRESRNELVRAISRLNYALQGESFICIAPGRWGSSNSDLGVSVNFGDIYNTSALIELTGPGIGPAPEPSLGTHFFQDLVEQRIYPLAINLADDQSIFNRAFFDDLPNRVREWIEIDDRIYECLRLLKVGDFRQGYHLRVVMSDEKNQAVAYLEEDQQEEL